IEAQERVTALEERRSLRAYGLTEGERRYYVPVQSRRLGCTGQVDMVIEPTQTGPSLSAATGLLCHDAGRNDGAARAGRLSLPDSPAPCRTCCPDHTSTQR